MSKRKFCVAKREIHGDNYYCTLTPFHDGWHSDEYGYWRDITPLELTIEQERELMREQNTKVRDWKGDPKRDPRLIKDLSSLIVPAPSFRK